MQFTGDGNDEEYKRQLIATFLIAKHLMPIFTKMPTAEVSDLEATSQATYSHISARQRETSVKENMAAHDNLVHLYELILHAIRNETDSQVTMAALEALKQILKAPPSCLLMTLLEEQVTDIDLHHHR